MKKRCRRIGHLDVGKDEGMHTQAPHIGQGFAELRLRAETPESHVMR